MKKSIAAALCGVFLLTGCGQKADKPVIASVSAAKSSTASTVISSKAESSASAQSSKQPQSSKASGSLPYYPPETNVIAPLCKANALYCIEDGELLYGENSDVTIAPASLTKLLTASVALKFLDPEEVCSVGSELALVQPDSSLCLITEGEQLTLYDLIAGLLLPSGNDAAYSIAVNTARKISSSQLTDEQAVKYFVDLMNDLAREIGMKNTHFANPEGWDNDNHYTTAADLARLGSYALSVPVIRELVSTTKYNTQFVSGEFIEWRNGNKLIHPESDYYCEYAIGMKTGMTDNAGCALIAAFAYNNKTYITSVVGCMEDDERYQTTLSLFGKVCPEVYVEESELSPEQ